MAMKDICTNGKLLEGTYSAKTEQKIHKAIYKYDMQTRKVVGFYKETGELIRESEIESKLDILVKGQIKNSEELEAIRNDLQRGFIRLALRNEELNQKLEIAVSELTAMKKEREEKAARREKWSKLKLLPKRRT